MKSHEIYPEEILKEAGKCDGVADALYQEIQQQRELGRELQPFITTDGEKQAPQEAVVLGALRQRAISLRERASGTSCP